MAYEKVYNMSFGKVYPLLVNKAVKKGRTAEEVNQLIIWLTGYSPEEVEQAAVSDISYGDFFRQAPEMNPDRKQIKGVVCGVRVEDIEEPLMQDIRYLDKLVDELAKGKAALAIGPGLGREEGAWLAIEALVRSDTPKVVDADALYLLAKYGGGVGANTVLTPHPGEMARLCGATVQAVLDAPVEQAQQLAADMNACVLLKGATTVIAHGEDVAMNVTGCDGMGTGGCGDVLTGTIAALLAQGMSVWDAARAGAYYHGRAGEAAQARLGARGVTAWDVCEALRIE